MINKFLKSYVTAFLSFSPSEIGKHYQFPAVFYTEAGDVISFTKEQFISSDESLLGKYKALGIKNIDYEVLNHNQVSNALDFVSVVWYFKSDDGDLIYSATTNYLLKKTHDSFTIASVIMVNEYTEFSKIMDGKV